MNYVEAPARPNIIELPMVFMGGGITDCPDWQTDLAHMLADFEKGTLFNPRREKFEDSPEFAKEQIEWEFIMLWQSPILIFWFCKETLCPISLFELGAHLVRSRLAKKPPMICIGIEPGYKRELDIREQTKLLAPATLIVTSLEDVANFIREKVPNLA